MQNYGERNLKDKYVVVIEETGYDVNPGLGRLSIVSLYFCHQENISTELYRFELWPLKGSTDLANLLIQKIIPHYHDRFTAWIQK